MLLRLTINFLFGYNNNSDEKTNHIDSGCCFLPVLTSCAGQEVSSTTGSQTGSTLEEPPSSQPLTTRVPEIESESSSESPPQAEATVETGLAEVAWLK